MLEGPFEVAQERKKTHDLHYRWIDKEEDLSGSTAGVLW